MNKAATNGIWAASPPKAGSAARAMSFSRSRHNTAADSALARREAELAQPEPSAGIIRARHSADEAHAGDGHTRVAASAPSA